MTGNELKKFRWIPKYILKELEANHNRHPMFQIIIFAGFQNTFSKNWKQITTPFHCGMKLSVLDSKIHSQRTGSKSQPGQCRISRCECWIPKYILKELEANHNLIPGRAPDYFAGFQNTFSKNWKQITTAGAIGH